MPANQYGFSLAEALGDAERIKGARMTNELNRMKLDEHKADKARNALLQPIRAKAAQGDTKAQQQLIGLDPENAPKFIKSVQDAKKGDLELMEKNVEAYGNQSAAILQTLERDPDMAMQAYKEWYASAPPEFRKTMPTTNIKSWLELSLAKATAMDDYLAEYKGVTHGNENLLIKGNKIVERTPKALTPEELKAKGISTAQINAVSRLITGTMGGDFIETPDGGMRYVGLDDSQARKAMAATTRAIELIEQMGPGSEAKASQQAMQELGLEFPEPTTASNKPAPAVSNEGSTERTAKSRFMFDPATGKIVELN